MTEQPPHVFRNELGTTIAGCLKTGTQCVTVHVKSSNVCRATRMRRLAWKSRSILASYTRKAKDE